MNYVYLSSLFSLHSQIACATDNRGKKNDNDFIPPGGVGIVFANSLAGKLYTEATVQHVFSDLKSDGGDEYTGHL